MKIIFSRKGCSSANGGMASPIFPDNSFLSIPAPGDGRLRLKDVMHRGKSLGPLVEQLKNERGAGRSGASLNPDLDPESLPRIPGWRPVLEQHGDALKHLESQHVGEGDVFLFFGEFREALNAGGARFRQERTPRHCIYGWLQVGAVMKPSAPDCPELPEWLSDSQVAKKALDNDGSLYVSTERLRILGMRRTLPGGGVFRLFNNNLVLTSLESERPGLWTLPHWIFPASRGKPPLSCHANMERWSTISRGSQLDTVDKDDEFVLNSEFYPESKEWLRGFFELAEVSHNAYSTIKRG